jgi:SAM-dependent methyltransferase
MDYLEMLARLGVGSAHPGGFTATLEQLANHPLPKGAKILEVGCGTGRTACYLAKQNYRITALDIRPLMIAKARKRAEEEGVAVSFVEGDVNALPFGEGEFDVVLAESVTIFADPPKALKEYCRVLAAGGKLYDREIMALKEPTEDLRKEVFEFYGARKLYLPGEWISLMKKSGFNPAEVWNAAPFPMNMWEDTFRHPDHLQNVDEGAMQDPRVWEVSFKYDDIMMRYHSYFGFGVLIGTKA